MVDSSHPNPSDQSPKESLRPPQRSSKKAKIASEDQCLAAMSNLPALVLQGHVSTAQASVIRAVYGAILSHHERRAAGHAGPGVVPELLDLARLNPHLAQLLEPFFSDAQVEELRATCEQEVDDVDES